MTSYLKTMQTFTKENLPSLKEAVLGALELFEQEKPKPFDFNISGKCLVVGSGNALTTGKIIFKNLDCFFASESNYQSFLKKDFNDVIIVSASGGKHAPVMAEDFNKLGKNVYLLTCAENSQTENIVGKDNTCVTLKNREPYAYNVSTYLGWILAVTNEDPKEILAHIDKNIKPLMPDNFVDYDGFLFATPNKFLDLNSLLDVKFIELFGRKVSRDIKTFGEIKHAVTIVPSETELCIKFGEDKVDFQNEVLEVQIEKDTSYGKMMAISFYIIGCIQEQLPQYYNNNIKSYVNRHPSENFGKVVNVIVE